MKKFNLRAGFSLAALVGAALLGYGFYLQYVQGQAPCPLCLVQRGFFMGLIAVFALAAVHGPQRLTQRIYSAFALMLALGGTATAARQVWLQHLPPELVPQCGPDLYFMMDNFPLSKVLTNLLRGSGQCAEVNWTFLGGSIALWSLIWFVIFSVFALYAILYQPKKA